MTAPARRLRKAVLPVAGLGTRVLPGTKTTPKELLNVVDRPILSYIVEEAREAGIEHIVFVTGRAKQAIEDYFDHQIELEAQLLAKGKTEILAMMTAELATAGEMSFTRQMQPLGLGHAVWCARYLVGDEPFAVLLADDLIKADVSCLKQMVDAHAETGGNMIALMDVPHDHTSRYGIIAPGAVTGRLTEVTGLVEKPKPADAPSNQAVVGRYILQPEVFQHLAGQQKGAGGEIQLTDALARMIGGAPFHGYRFEGTRFDCGDKVGFFEANLAFALERADLRDGVIAFIKKLGL